MEIRGSAPTPRIGSSVTPGVSPRSRGSDGGRGEVEELIWTYWYVRFYYVSFSHRYSAPGTLEDGWREGAFDTREEALRVLREEYERTLKALRKRKDVKILGHYIDEEKGVFKVSWDDGVRETSKFGRVYSEEVRVRVR